MALKILTIHQNQRGFVSDGVEEYLKRIQRFLPVEFISITSPKKWNNLSVNRLKEEEGEKLLQQISANDLLVLLDERGKEFSSISFADQLEQMLATTSGDVIFCIGGAYGFSDSVYQRANRKLSLSKMTFSHQLIRVIFLEQVYRALTIINGHPYHNE